MSGEDPEDKKVENPAAEDDSIDDNSLDDVFEVDETFEVDGDFEVDPEAAEALAAMAESSDVVVGATTNQQPTLDATLSDSIRLADELVKTRIEKIHEAGEKSVSQAVESMETLIGSVLDATEAATRASAAASTSTTNLVKSAGRLTQTADRSSRISTIVLSVGGAMLFISVAVFGFMAAQLAQRTGELESMVMAVGKRVVEMNVAFGEFTAVTDSIDQLRLTQETFRDSLYQLSERVNGMTEMLQAVKSEVPVTTAESVGRQSEVFTARVSDVEGQIQAQQKITADLAKSMQGLAGQMSSLRKQISSVSELNKDVEALVTLQRERYYELLQAQANATKAQSGSAESQAEQVIIRYPNPDAPLPLPEKAN
jgi:myosin heavy subunit